MKHVVAITDLRINRGSAFSLYIPLLTARPGSIVCVTGPNGSGKTTLIESIVGLVTGGKDNGAVRVNGQSVNNNLRTTKAMIGFIPDEENWFIKELSAQEYFELLISIYAKIGISVDRMKKRIVTLAAALYFTAFDQRLETLSHGNKKKVQIIAGLMHSPRLVIMDELRNGLDPLAIIAAEKIIRDEAARNTCIIAATHDLWWAERIANDVILLVNGRPVLNQAIADIIKEYGSLEKAFIATVSISETHHAL